MNFYVKNTSEVEHEVQKRSNINALGPFGRTALMFACRDGYLGAVKSLLEHGANVDLKDRQGKTALDYAIENNHVEIVASLREHKQNIVHKTNWPKRSGGLVSLGDLIRSAQNQEREEEKKKTKIALEIKKKEEEQKQEEIRRKKKKLQTYYEDFNFYDAERFFHGEQFISLRDFREIRGSALREYFNTTLSPELLTKLNILQEQDFLDTFQVCALLLNDLDFEKALQIQEKSRSTILKEIYENIKTLIVDQKYKNILESEVLQLIKENSHPHLLFPIVESLLKYDFQQADSIYENKRHLLKESYVPLKGYFVKKYLDSAGIRKCSVEQANTIAHPVQNLLVRARAGSGKTTTIVNKALFEIKKNGLTEENIRILAFNDKAAKHLSHKLKEVGFQKERIASTFHSLAHEICAAFDNNLPILDTLKEKNKKAVIHDILKEELSELASREALYNAVRNSNFCIDGIEYGQLLMKKRSLPIYKKYIADFLFEHLFSYEKKENVGLFLNYYLGVLDKNKNGAYADFALVFPEHTICIRQISSEKESVQEFFSKKENKKEELFEILVPTEEMPSTHSMDLKEQELNRVSFIKKFESILLQCGISVLEQKNKEELVTSFFNEYQPDFEKNCLSVIDQYQQKTWSLADIEEAIKNFEENYPSCEYLPLVKVSKRVYQKYGRYLNVEQKTDFAFLLADAEECIQQLKKAENLTEKHLSLRQKIMSWKLLCVDEYQDFSLLFFKLISAIKQLNPSLRLFCVGDDWQAINSFAGSDICYFNDFEEYIKKEFNQEADRILLRTNRRSTNEILEISNYFKTRNAHSKEGAEGTNKHIPFGVQKLSLEYFNSEKLKKYMQNSNANIQLRIIADGLAQILQQNKALLEENKESEMHCLVLSRRGSTLAELKEFFIPFTEELALKRGIKIVLDKDKLDFMTAHKSKGLESEIVVVLLEENSFPLVHPANEMMQGMFNVPCLDQESNLFYVAMTRARKKVYFMGIKDVFKSNGYFQTLREHPNLKITKYKGIEEGQVVRSFSGNFLRRNF